MRKVKMIFISCGIMLILAAIALCGYNVWESRRAYNESQKVMKVLTELIPAPSTDENTSAPSANPADDIYAAYEAETTSEPAPVNVNGRYYCGYLSLPSLGLELPVIDDWSYDALELSPCRFSGHAAANDLVIAAHNYNSHFGRIADLENGDGIFFTDTNGNVHRYSVEDIRVLDGSDSEGMFSGEADEWDITLFTCTLSGRSRVAVRGCR